MQDFRKLRVWQDNRSMVADIYRVTQQFPSVERFGLTAQMRRAVIGVGASIAEGCGRGSKADSVRLFQIGFGSATELLQHIIVAHDLGYIDQQQFAELDDKSLQIRKQLAVLMSKMR